MDGLNGGTGNEAYASRSFRRLTQNALIGPCWPLHFATPVVFAVRAWQSGRS
jgi:hypothetical protein